ncbi:MAG: flippase-like domain-containing protein [Candidatus Bathyarchaeota archaeon]|nr:flippase-like domain-containing protein [Candidatus Bathyarchaeota archaeon]
MDKRALAFTLVGVVFFAAYLAWANPFAAFAEVGSFNIGIYAVAIIIDLIGLLLWAASWYLILRAMKVKISLWGTTQLSFTSLFIGWLAPLPLMTEMVRAYLIKDRSSSNLGKGLSSVLVHRSYYNIAFGAVIGGTALLTLASGREIPINPGVCLFLTAFALISVVVFSLMLNTRALRYIYGKSPQWVRRNVFDRFHDPESGEEGFGPVIEDIGEAVRDLRAGMGLNLAAFVMLLFHWSAGAVTAYLSAEALGVHLEVSTVVFAFAVVEFLQQMNFFIPSGIGLLDAGLAGALVLAGVPLSTAAAISLLTRIATYWLEVLVCVPVAFRFGYKEFLAKYFAGK